MAREMEINVQQEIDYIHGRVPKSIGLPDGSVYCIRRVVDILDMPGVGVRYCCDLGGRERYIWERRGHWYIYGDAGYLYPF